MPLNEEYVQIGYDIIASAFEVRNSIGRGLREKFYEGALAYEISQKGYEVKRQVLIPAIYKGVVVEEAYKADIVVDNRVIIEVKAVGQMKENECRQLLTYLKLSDHRLGYLINFGAKLFKPGKVSETMPYKNGIYRFVNNI